MLWTLFYYNSTITNNALRMIGVEYTETIEPKALVDNDQLQYSGKCSWVLIFAFQCQETIYPIALHVKYQCVGQF